MSQLNAYLGRLARLQVAARTLGARGPPRVAQIAPPAVPILRPASPGYRTRGRAVGCYH